MSKYEFTGETRDHFGTTLRRIRARSSFGDVTAGDLGGWIESEGNLAQTGAAWVSGDARVYGAARVYGDAWVYGAARVCGDARVYGAAHLLCIGPVGSRRAVLTVTRDEKRGLRFTTGCFSGSRTEFVEAVETTHADCSVARIEYDAAIAMVDAWARANDQAQPEPAPAEPAEVQS